MTGAGGLLTVKARLAVPVPPELDAPMVTLKVPTEFGAPEITPVKGLRVNPPGKPVALNEVGVLVAVIV